jgi:hypothetical protein
VDEPMDVVHDIGKLDQLCVGFRHDFQPVWSPVAHVVFPHSFKVRPGLVGGQSHVEEGASVMGGLGVSAATAGGLASGWSVWSALTGLCRPVAGCTALELAPGPLGRLGHGLTSMEPRQVGARALTLTPLPLSRENLWHVLSFCGPDWFPTPPAPEAVPAEPTPAEPTPADPPRPVCGSCGALEPVEGPK